MIARTLRTIARGPQPRTEPPVTHKNLPPLHGRLEFIRDANAVAHIYAEDERDLYAVAGYLQGVERLFLIDMLRHIGAGRLAELVGNLRVPRGLNAARGKRVGDIDSFMRPLDYERECRDGYARLEPDAKACLDAFAAGVNAALRAMCGVYPPEYLLLRNVRPWHPIDSLLAARTCAFIVSLTAFENELTFDGVRGRIGDEAARRLYPDAPWEHVPTTYSVTGPVQEPQPPIEALGAGSNNWAVTAKLSASGKPIFANDPHVPFLPLPTFWHHVHFDCPRYRVQGGLFPGCPTFGFAHNGFFAWGVTTGFRDAWDLYRIHRLPDDPTRYRTASGIGQITRHRELLQFRFGGARTIEWETCEHGILYPGWRHHDGTELSVRHISADMAHWFEGHRLLQAATTVDSYRAALAFVNDGPFDFNHVYAHVGGEVAWELVGRLPQRVGDGLFVRDADDPKGQWNGFIPFEKMPKIRNPPRGFVASANSIVDPEQYSPIATAVHFEPRYRQNRIESHLAASQAHSLESFARIQSDVFAYYAPAQRDALLRLIEPLAQADDSYGRAYRALAQWEGNFDLESVGASLLFVTRLQLVKKLFVPLLGPDLGLRYAGGRRALPRLHELLLHENDPLRADLERATGKPLAEVAMDAFRAAVDHLVRHGGPLPNDWRWKHFHRIRMGTLLSLVPGLGKYFVAIDEPFPADEYTPNPSRPIPMNGKFYAFVGATSRFICDLANPEEAFFAHTSGPSADVGSLFFANLSKPWLRFEYFRSALWKPEEVPSRLEHVVVASGV